MTHDTKTAAAHSHTHDHDACGCGHDHHHDHQHAHGHHHHHHHAPSQPIRVMKVGRNDPCPCGSQKKYKKCCLTEARA